MEFFRLLRLFEWLKNGALFANIECGNGQMEGGGH